MNRRYTVNNFEHRFTAQQKLLRDQQAEIKEHKRMIQEMMFARHQQELWEGVVTQPSPDPQSNHNGLFTSLFFFVFFLGGGGCFLIDFLFIFWFMSIFLPSSDRQSSRNGLFMSLGFWGVFSFLFLVGFLVYVHFPAIPGPSFPLQWSLYLWVFFGGGGSFVFWFMSISQLSPDPQSSLNGLFTSLGFFCFWFMSISLPSLDPQSSHNGLFISLFFCFVFLNNFVCGCFGVLCPFFLVQQQWSLLFSGFFGMFFLFFNYYY